MQALILAAGFGKRLRPITDVIPKCLVEVAGTPLLLNSLNCLSGRNITEVLIIVGDKKEQIINRCGHSYNGMKITYIENPLYQETNNVYSFWLAKNYIHDDLLMFECDLFYRRSLVDRLLEQSRGVCNILVSPYNAATMDGTVVAVGDNDKVKALITKRDQDASFNYARMNKTVNIYFYKKEFITKKFMPAVETYITTQSLNSYYELVLGSLIFYKNDDICAVYIDPIEWCEIDNADDLKRANEQFKDNRSL
jgi:NDP-sugar pyrophosphorylase family protein